MMAVGFTQYDNDKLKMYDRVKFQLSLYDISYAIKITPNCFGDINIVSRNYSLKIRS